MNISKNEEEKNLLFLNLLKPRKLASRVGEKQILTELRKKQVSFSENCNFLKTCFRVGESSILKKKLVKVRNEAKCGEVSF